MGMKLVTIICLCQLYRFWIGADRSFSVLQRFSPRSSLLLSLSVLMLPQLQKRMVEATLALKARGALCQGRSFRMKARAYYILFRVLLAAVLEDSWAKAEALYSRGYGLGRRSSYEAERWKSSDALYAGALLLVLSLSIWRFIQGGGHTRYYPSIVSHDSFIDFWVLALQAVFFTCLLVVTKQSEQRSADSAI
jgi:energy-coupling factor transport system permease protein